MKFNDFLKITEENDPNLQSLSRLYKACPDSERVYKLIVAAYLPGYQPSTARKLITRLRQRFPDLFPFKSKKAAELSELRRGKGKMDYDLEPWDAELQRLSSCWKQTLNYKDLQSMLGKDYGPVKKLIIYYRAKLGVEFFPRPKKIHSEA